MLSCLQNISAAETPKQTKQKSRSGKASVQPEGSSISPLVAASTAGSVLAAGAKEARDVFS